MVKLLVNKPIEVEVTEMHIYLKCRDEFFCKLYDSNGNMIKDYEGYVPNSIVPGEYGDYLDLKIDINTGKILNWKVPDKETLEDFMKRDS
jgi:hypothetical protein